jgi:hypothetical protein
MTDMNRDQTKLVSLASHRVPITVQFPNLDHFLAEVAENQIDTVRLDIFEVVRPSPLSFVQYVAVTLYVTAQDPARATVYEYVEPVTTLTSSDPLRHDEAVHLAVDAAADRLHEVEQRMASTALHIRRGRYVGEAQGTQ